MCITCPGPYLLSFSYTFDPFNNLLTTVRTAEIIAMRLADLFYWLLVGQLVETYGSISTGLCLNIPSIWTPAAIIFQRIKIVRRLYIGINRNVSIIRAILT